MTALLVFVVAGIGTYAARSAFVLALGDRTLPPLLERALRNVGPAVLAALTASLLVSDGVGAFVTDLPKVASAVVAVYVAWRTRHFLWTFGAGLAVLWMLQAIL